MSCREDTIVLIPLQRILTKISHRLSQVRDVGGVSGNIGSVIGDIGGIGLDIVIGSFQLRTVNRIRTGSRNSAGFNVGDGAGGICTMCRTISLFNGVPLYRVIV